VVFHNIINKENQDLKSELIVKSEKQDLKNTVVHCESDDSLILDLSDQAEVFLFITRRQ
jgi:hypothetical protein